MDLFVVPTLSFRLLLWLADFIGTADARILWLGVTAHPSAEWIARQLTEACGWEWNPCYIVRDRDRVYCEIFHPAASCHGHSRPANYATLAMAEWPYGTADWLYPTGMP